MQEVHRVYILKTFTSNAFILMLILIIIYIYTMYFVDTDQLSQLMVIMHACKFNSIKNVNSIIYNKDVLLWLY